MLEAIQVLRSAFFCRLKKSKINFVQIKCANKCNYAATILGEAR